MSDQFIMKGKQTIVLNNPCDVEKVNTACDLMEKLTGKSWSVNKWFKKNAMAKVEEYENE
ncbi:hypothetical protein [Endozoicomonas sp. GU-1]|uniref:hypothetical protein n=1 Tax=Endozoicomonas sp. GU-1 TaxID=3009078 RepID=UPI0022B2CC6E|nr:hypothetical protein [Endozoicomonas sp. GU-1]WBA81948.1 hypothetical protein O2T12_01910 [Endozoicomonas sp. GU-1]WBA84898.1 hypothetical protein O3276_16690 [Endozoicomonas sp. GU-1]